MRAGSAERESRTRGIAGKRQDLLGRQRFKGSSQNSIEPTTTIGEEVVFAMGNLSESGRSSIKKNGCRLSVFRPRSHTTAATK